ncbi:aspartate/glutamate racemase family protein [Salinisphaera hydrothermalis]|uniref:Aspartate racemase n=1 Tax=Salinisphaera hydrothermalis (strain C41B8) TaxID=1304275 RepID=A0A084IKQ9_SALHC|nr:amino acid racemase [Salinisphaera hydrothermalis]KEZ77293.1 aspartate racemase [Salinisphaera hydrothermalis C41B8]
MKTIGLPGGTAWPSTLEYYRYLNQLAQREFGPRHSARLLLKSIDYAPFIDCYGTDWPGVLRLFEPELAELFAMRPDCVVVCCNTLHRAIDELADRWPTDVPIIHIVDETARVAIDRGYDRVLLLGTQFTMENGYYAGRLEAAGLTVDIPAAEERARIQHIQSAISAGHTPNDAEAYFQHLLSRHANCDAAVLACTELPAATNAETSPLPLLDPLTLQCDAAFAFAVDR